MFIFLLTEIKGRTFPKGRRGRVWWWDHGWFVNWGPVLFQKVHTTRFKSKPSSVLKFKQFRQGRASLFI